VSDGPSGRPGQPGRPHRFYFDDLADEVPDEQPPADEPAAQVEPEPPGRPVARQPRDDGDDDLVDTGPIQVIRDPVPGSAAGQQLYFDDLAPLQHASAGDSAYGAHPDSGPFDDEQSADESSYGEPAYAGIADGSPADDDSDDERPVRGALALAAARKPRPVGAVIAVLAVLALIGVLAAVSGRGNSDHPKQDAAAVRNAPGKAHPSSAPTTEASASASAPGTTATSPGSSAPTHRKAAVPGRAPAGVALTVLNNTTTQGLAKSAAQVFSTRGWQVGTVGNYAGQISVTTVYYNSDDAAQRKAAQTLAAQFPGVTQVQPRFASLPGAGLTVVLAPDWHA
jgi:hypothetical protein